VDKQGKNSQPQNDYYPVRVYFARRDRQLPR
jgi:hypothetical protein